MKSVTVINYPREALVRFARAYLEALGATGEESAIVADGIVTAAARWHPGKGQGLEKLFRLTRQCENGGVVPGAPFEILRETPATALVDAHKGFGYVTGVRAMRLAVSKAQTVGTGSVLIRHSNHFGQAGYHAEVAVKAGMIGWAMTNAAAEMAPWGAKTAVVGTNPWGIGIPRAAGFPILLDMALSASGRGMVQWAHRANQPIPDHWVLTADGRRSTDPGDYIAEDGRTFVGTQLPIGEFKGYGLSLFTDIVTGVLSGSLFGTQVFTDLSNHDVGHFMFALNPEIYMDRNEFDHRIEELVAQIRAAEPIDPDSPIYLPGELEFLREQERMAGGGIPVDAETVEGLRRLAQERSVACAL